jgi:pyruvate dehydrogenase E2 component (dihydrolipoamide acetyltransferase)
MDIRLPSLGEGADSGVVVSILVKEGDQLQKDQPVLELETEKAVGTIPAPAAGIVQAVRVKVGDKISVGQVILTLAEGEAAPAPAAPSAPPPAPVSKLAVGPAASAIPKAIPGIPPAASPTVRKIAAQLGLDLSQIAGSGAGGRIELQDLRAYIQRLQALAAPPPASARPAAERVDFAQFGPVLKKSMSSLRKTIARRMSESWSAVPRVTQFDEADITALNDRRKKEGFTLTVYAIKAVVHTLKKHPLLNSSLDEAAAEIVLKEYFHIGIAVDTEHGLMVPVIRDADKKSLAEISKELEDLAGKTRDRKLTADQMRGGSFTISNQGGIGSGAFTPIVNRPEVAILGMGRAARKPVVTAAGQIEARLMLPLALSYDHRVIDGGSAARFMVDLVQAFQNFDEKGI